MKTRPQFPDSINGEVPDIGTLRVLTYHRVAEPGSDAGDPSSISATPACFARQMQYLARHYTPISATDLLRSLDSDVHLPPRAVLVTFDDAYTDFGETAWPILKRLGVPATLFVPTAYASRSLSSFWWERLYAAFMYTQPMESGSSSDLAQLSRLTPADRLQRLRATKAMLKSMPHERAMQEVDRICSCLGGARVRLPNILTWAHLRPLAEQGVAICGHTQTHPLLARVTPERVRAEIDGAQQDIQREIGIALPVIAYPGGSCDELVLETVREEGIRLAFTTLDGHNDMRNSNLLRLRRTNITMRTSPAVFPFRLSKAGTYFDMVRHGTLWEGRRQLAW